METLNLTPKELAERYTVDDIKSIISEAKTAADKATTEFLSKWEKQTGGNKYGEPMCCGFSWINIFAIKGNTKIGKLFKEAGVKRDYSRTLIIWNPSNYKGQSVDAKLAGSEAAAEVFNKYGFVCGARSRAD